MLLNTLVIIGEVFGMHHQLGGSTEDDMNKMSVIGHISLFFMYMFFPYMYIIGFGGSKKRT